MSTADLCPDRRPRSSRVPDLLLAGALLFYLLCALTLAHTAPLYSDDYLNCGTLCQLVYGTPYHDFVPWNNLLGHYIQLPAMLAYPDPVLGPITVRMELAIAGFLALSVFAWWLRKDYSPLAVFLGLLCFALMDFFVLNTLAVRLDALSAWAGFAALLFALRGRWLTSGLCCAVAFMISQKAVYHFAALNTALLVLFVLAPDRWGGLKRALRFNAALLAGAAGYYLTVYLLWKTGDTIARHNEDKLQTLEGFYRIHGLLELSLRYVFVRGWEVTTLGLAGLALAIREGWSLFRKGKKTREEPAFRSAVVFPVYLMSMFFFCCFHPHPYGYFWIILIPGLWFAVVKALDAGLAFFCGRSLEQQITMICLGGSLILLLAGLWIPRRYWTTEFFLWMCLGIPTAMTMLCLPLYRLARRWSRTRPELLPGLFVAVLVPVLFFASTADILLRDRLFQSACYREELAREFFIPKLNKMLEHLRQR